MNKILLKSIAVVAAVSVVGSTGYAIYAQEIDDKDTAKASDLKIDQSEIPTDLINLSNEGKDEKVYIIQAADGTAQKVIVSNHIFNDNDSDTIVDKTTLENIENVKADFDYTTNDDGTITWNAAGQDVYYQGTTSSALPVDIAITYKLDGEEISPDELAGKSGKVEINVKYSDNAKISVNVGNSTQDIYVPFLALTGMVLDSNNFKNVQVSNGKVIDDGDRCFVIGFGLPGAKENLGDDSLISGMDELTITADATDFSLLTTASFVTNEVFNSVDVSKLATKDAAAAFISQVVGKSPELSSAIAQLTGGSQNTDIDTAVKTALAQYMEGVNTILASSPKINAGAKQVFDSLLAQVQTQLKAASIDAPTLTVDNYKTVLSGIVANISDENVTKLVTAKVLEGVLSSQGLTMDQYAALDDATKAKLDAAVKAQMATTDVQTQLKTQLATAKAGRDTINGAIASLDSYNQFYTGVLQYTAGVDKALGITKQLTGEISNVELNFSSLEGTLEKINAMLQVSKNYNTFSGKSDDMVGTVQFIYRTASIGE